MVNLADQLALSELVLVVDYEESLTIPLAGMMKWQVRFSFYSISEAGL